MKDRIRLSGDVCVQGLRRGGGGGKARALEKKRKIRERERELGREDLSSIVARE